MNRLTASLMVLLGATSYGLLSPFVKLAYDAGFSPQEVTSSQFLFALLILAVLSGVQWDNFKRLRRTDIWLLGVLGLCATGTSIFYYVALNYLPATLAIVLLFQSAWIVFIIDYFVTRRKPSGMRWAAILMIVCGTFLAVNLFEKEWKEVSSFGLMLGVLSSISWSAFLYLNEKVTSQAPAIINSFVQVVVSTVVIMLVFPPRFLWNGSIGQGLWVWAAIIGLLGQVIPPVLFNKGIPLIGGALAGVLAVMELPVAIVSASLVLGEFVNAWQWSGILLIVLGIVVAQLRTTKIEERKESNKS
ncbi:EamA family transporter [Effusibacillus dendaii]|uniref:Multidrug transporter n=1 Tax=Effusibacillus dendaii TaxID=2743772 RepID=A0A7I8DDV6_9BACL|nr:DMT family transporter [Effusibacillus dendaii]BCJ87139.1 multidrug transporter [Effusibacillus dendaii]